MKMKTKSKDNCIYIHVGTPKTGTTSIQSFLFNPDNKIRLAKEGFSYPDFWNIWRRMNLYRDEEESPNVGNGMNLDWYITSNATERDKKYIKKIISNELESAHVIISDEDIWPRCTEQIIDFYKEITNNIKIIVYLRRQDCWIESWWNMNISRYNGFDSIMEYAMKEDGDYYSKLKIIESKVGKNNIIIRPYEQNRFYMQHIEYDFLRQLGIDNVEDYVIGEKENQKVDSEHVELAYWFNKQYYPYREDYNPQVSSFLLDINLEEKSYLGFLQPDERKAIIEKYEECNKLISECYFYGEPLFEDQNVDIPCYSWKFSEREKNIVSAFANYIRMQECSSNTNRKMIQAKVKIYRLINSYRKLFYYIMLRRLYRR